MGQRLTLCKTPESCSSDATKITKNRREREEFNESIFNDGVWADYLNSPAGQKHQRLGWIQPSNIQPSNIQPQVGKLPSHGVETKEPENRTQRMKSAAKDMTKDVGAGLTHTKMFITSMMGRAPRTKFQPLPLPDGQTPIIRKVWGKDVVCVRKSATKEDALV